MIGRRCIWTNWHASSHWNYGRKEVDITIWIRGAKKPHPFIAGLTYGEADLYKNDVNKVCFLESPVVPFERIKQEFEGKFEVIQCTVPIFGEGSGELMVPGIHKAIAIADDITGTIEEDGLYHSFVKYELIER